MHSRIATTQSQPEHLDEMMQRIREQTVPLLQSQQGYGGFYFLINREIGKAIGISLWETKEDERADVAASDPVVTAERAYGVAGRVIAGVRPEQLDDPTPCSEWDVQALMNHMIGAHFYFTGALRGQEMDPNMTPPDFAANNPAGTLAQPSEAMLEAWRQPGALDRTVQTLHGPLPATILIGMFTVGNLTHAWDLPCATGQDENLDPEMATQVLAMVRQVNLPRGEGAPFKEEQPAPSNATPELRLAAYLGRSV